MNRLTILWVEDSLVEELSGTPIPVEDLMIDIDADYSDLFELITTTYTFDDGSQLESIPNSMKAYRECENLQTADLILADYNLKKDSSDQGVTNIDGLLVGAIHALRYSGFPMCLASATAQFRKPPQEPDDDISGTSQDRTAWELQRILSQGNAFEFIPAEGSTLKNLDELLRLSLPGLRKSIANSLEQGGAMVSSKSLLALDNVQENESFVELFSMFTGFSRKYSTKALFYDLLTSSVADPLPDDVLEDRRVVAVEMLRHAMNSSGLGELDEPRLYAHSKCMKLYLDGVYGTFSDAVIKRKRIQAAAEVLWEDHEDAGATMREVLGFDESDNPTIPRDTVILVSGTEVGDEKLTSAYTYADLLGDIRELGGVLKTSEIQLVGTVLNRSELCDPVHNLGGAKQEERLKYVCLYALGCFICICNRYKEDFTPLSFYNWLCPTSMHAVNPNLTLASARSPMGFVYESVAPLKKIRIDRYCAGEKNQKGEKFDKVEKDIVLRGFFDTIDELQSQGEIRGNADWNSITTWTMPLQSVLGSDYRSLVEKRQKRKLAAN